MLLLAMGNLSHRNTHICAKDICRIMWHCWKHWKFEGSLKCPIKRDKFHKQLLKELETFIGTNTEIYFVWCQKQRKKHDLLNAKSKLLSMYCMITHITNTHTRDKPILLLLFPNFATHLHVCAIYIYNIQDLVEVTPAWVWLVG